jgi:hypothetical protein
MTSKNNSLMYLPPKVSVVHVRTCRNMLVSSSDIVRNVDTEDLVEVEW